MITAHEPMAPGETAAAERAKTVVRRGPRVAVVAGLALWLAHVVNVSLLDGAIAALDLDREHNESAWLSTSAIFAAALGAALLALLEHGRRALLLAPGARHRVPVGR